MKRFTTIMLIYNSIKSFLDKKHSDSSTIRKVISVLSRLQETIGGMQMGQCFSFEIFRVNSLSPASHRLNLYPFILQSSIYSITVVNVSLPTLSTILFFFRRASYIGGNPISPYSIHFGILSGYLVKTSEFFSYLCKNNLS